MRTQIILLGLGLCLIHLTSGCTRLEKEEQHQREIGLAESRRDSLENELVNTMDEINRNLEIIREKQGLISGGGHNEDVEKRKSILENISLINALLEDNKRKIVMLSEQSELLGKEKKALARLAQQTRERIQRQEKEIASLKIMLSLEEFKVADLNVKMDELAMSNERLEAEKEELELANAQFDKDLNMAWFTYGTMQQLKEKGITEKKTGMIPGRRSLLSQGFFKNQAYYSELDIRDIKEIPVQGKKPRLLTFHPREAYRVEENGQYSKIIITEPAAFWSTSRFLVVEVR